jgi:hypothetical protein
MGNDMYNGEKRDRHDRDWTPGAPRDFGPDNSMKKTGQIQERGQGAGNRRESEVLNSLVERTAEEVRRTGSSDIFFNEQRGMTLLMSVIGEGVLEDLSLTAKSPSLKIKDGKVTFEVTVGYAKVKILPPVRVKLELEETPSGIRETYFGGSNKLSSKQLDVYLAAAEPSVNADRIAAGQFPIVLKNYIEERLSDPATSVTGALRDLFKRKDIDINGVEIHIGEIGGEDGLRITVLGKDAGNKTGVSDLLDQLGWPHAEEPLQQTPVLQEEGEEKMIEEIKNMSLEELRQELPGLRKSAPGGRRELEIFGELRNRVHELGAEMGEDGEKALKTLVGQRIEKLLKAGEAGQTEWERDLTTLRTQGSGRTRGLQAAVLEDTWRWTDWMMMREEDPQYEEIGKLLPLGLNIFNSEDLRTYIKGMRVKFPGNPAAEFIPEKKLAEMTVNELGEELRGLNPIINKAQVKLINDELRDRVVFLGWKVPDFDKAIEARVIRVLRKGNDVAAGEWEEAKRIEREYGPEQHQSWDGLLQAMADVEEMAARARALPVGSRERREAEEIVNKVRFTDALNSKQCENITHMTDWQANPVILFETGPDRMRFEAIAPENPTAAQLVDRIVDSVGDGHFAAAYDFWTRFTGVSGEEWGKIPGFVVDSLNRMFGLMGEEKYGALATLERVNMVARRVMDVIGEAENGFEIVYAKAVVAAREAGKKAPENPGILNIREGLLLDFVRNNIK